MLSISVSSKCGQLLSKFWKLLFLICKKGEAGGRLVLLVLHYFLGLIIFAESCDCDASVLASPLFCVSVQAASDPGCIR